MKKKSVLCILAVLRCAAAAVALEPCTLRQNFQDSSLGQWASYPPVQDAGYDPSLSPATGYGAPGGRSLMRTIRPTEAGPLRFGFIRRLDMANRDGARVSFSYRLKGAREGDEMEIGLACANGQKYVKRVPVAASGEWSNAEAQFDNLPRGAAIQAVYLTADVRRADPDVDYRFLIDNVELHAARTARFRVSVPATTEIEPWPELISDISYEHGAAISIRASASAALTRVEYTLRDPNGRQAASRRLEFRDGAWTAAWLYTPRESDPAGIWTIDLNGVKEDGQSIETTVRLLVMPAASAHPRLYFSASDHATLAARARTQMALWEHLEELAKTARDSGSIADGGRVTEMLDPVHLLPTLPGYFDVLTRASNRIAYNALTGYVNGDRQARAAAKQALLEVARWPTWTPPWFGAHGQHTYYPVGQLATDVALGYDLLYDDLSSPERSLVRRALIEHSIIPTYKEYVLDNRIVANTSNWIAHTVGGALIAIAAIRGDGDDSQLAMYAGGLLRKLEDHMAASYLPGGSYGEGISYQEFDLSTLTLAMTALARNLGVDYWMRTNVTKSLEYPLYAMANPIEATQDMGDSHPPSGYSAAGVVLHSKDPVMRWYYDQFPHRSILDFLLFPGDGPAQPPTSTSRIFPERGNAIFRTGWKPNDTVFLYRAGPDFNHNHADQGSFLLRALGENFATDAGYADYYKDPYYGSYFSQAAGHNTVLVDGDPESQSVADTRAFSGLHAYPRITDAITSDFYDALGSELAAVYKGRLERFTRRIAFMKPNYFVIYDDLAARGEPASFDWLLHVNDKSRFSIGTPLSTYCGGAASMGVKVLAPETARASMRDGHLTYSTFNPKAPAPPPPQPGILDIQSGPRSRETRFLIVLLPERGGADAVRKAAEPMRKITGDGCIGAGAGGDLVLFRTTPMRGKARCADTIADAAAWTISEDGGSLKLLAGESSRLVERAGRKLMESDTALNFAARYMRDRVDLAISPRQPARFEIFTGWKPANVTLDRTALTPAYDSRTGTVTLSIPAGEHSIQMNRAE